MTDAARPNSRRLPRWRRRRIGPPVVAVACDVREPDAVDAMLDEVLKQQGFIDILVNNAGGQFMAPAESISGNGFRAVTRLNLDATWYVTTQVASRSMIERGYGKIVSITMTPRRGLPGCRTRRLHGPVSSR